VGVGAFEERVNFSGEHSPPLLTRPAARRFRARCRTSRGLGQFRALMNKTGVEFAHGLIKSGENALRGCDLTGVCAAHKSAACRVKFAARRFPISGECRSPSVEFV
jgi:hypothetical protein